MSWANALFGKELLVKEGDKVVSKPSEEVIKGKKFVVLYFSAHWCGPCRKFTPLLSVTYEDRDDKDEVEVIFVSADHDMDGFDEYYAEMPWASVPFPAAEREAIPDKFNVQGIPRVVVLSGADGSVVNDDARNVIATKKSLSGVF